MPGVNLFSSAMIVMASDVVRERGIMQ